MRRAITLIAALACWAGTPWAAEAPPPKLVQAPHYGDTLFHFFQDHYFSAITGLMTSQHFNRLSPHDDEAELLRGGMLLSYGLHREAGEVFAKLLDAGAKAAVQDRARFFLAKIRYQRGLLPEALDALGRIGKQLPPALEEERALLHANVLLASQDYAGAAQQLKALSALKTTTTGASLYARYNLGVALVRSGDVAGGRVWLDELGKATSPALPATPEYRALRDQANLALGFAMLRDEKPDAASGYLQRVRLEGPQSSKALLGYGWALAAAKKHREALVPWQELLRRDARDAAVLEARLAVPLSYVELGALGQALTRYQEAIALYGQESRSLDESIAAIRAGRLIEGLLAANPSASPGAEMSWFDAIQSLPAMPHAGHLSDVLAQHEFQEAFKNLRDLQFLAGNLQAWQDKVEVYGDMVAHRRQAYAQRLPQVLAQANAAGLGQLQAQRDALATELDRVEREVDIEALATPAQRALLERVQRVNASLKALLEEPGLDAARQRARLATGLLTWQLAQDHADRLWSAQKELRTIDRELAEARDREAALARAQQQEPARFDAFATRTQAEAARIAALIPQVARLTQQQQQAAQEIAIAQLVKQKERLALYSTEAHFAVAQLHDRAAQAEGKKEGDRAK
ncbi:hypothetical protein [Roseateles paludis]|uniref:Tetratricopeptide repeat protein n=1 Tax=Roseateles paludis TaxID=3145238 RepID=A0ABV0G5P3_9BURK